jgi:hypothetical protein
MSVTREELLALLKNHEDNFIERKPDSIKPAEIRRTVSAFANTVPKGRFAVLFIGVRDDGTITGCQNPDAKQKAVRESSEQDCYPPIKMTSEVLRLKDGDVVAVVIGASHDRPHFTGQAYERRGSESVAASPELYRELITRNNGIADALLDLKSQVVSYISLDHRAGEVRRVPGGQYREGGECRVLDCNAHFARFEIIGGTGGYFNEPLPQIQIRRDENKYRPLLVFTSP